MGSVLSTASTEDIEQPTLLSRLNALDQQLTSEEHCKMILNRLGAQSVEKLIHLVQPKQVRIDLLEIIEPETGEDKDTDTPPTHNLSRVDERSVCVEVEDEKEPRGLDYAVRLSAATVLARLGYCPLDSSEEGVRLLQSRICTAVNDFLSCSSHKEGSSGHHLGQTSFDLIKRYLRLQMIVTTTENENFLASLLYATEFARDQKQRQVQNDNSILKVQLESSQKREQKLEREKNHLIQRLKTLSITLQREADRKEKNAIQDARQLVAIHAAERSKAENHVLEFARRVTQAESKLEDVERRAEAASNAESTSREELRHARVKLIELKGQNDELRRRIAEEEAKANEIVEDLRSKNEELSSIGQQYQTLEEEIRARDTELADVQDNNCKLHDNLEDLFGDLVSLAQIYQAKEKDAELAKESAERALRDLSNKLHAERTRCEELREREEALKRENEKLYNKVTKYKERLEEERRERQEQSDRLKRQGPVSYINQLHQSGSSRGRSGTTDVSSRVSSTHRGKENSYSASSLRSKHR